MRFDSARIWWSAAIAAILLTSGCTSWNWRGDGFGDDAQRWGEKMRKPGAPGESTALSTKAAEIDRDLGVR